MEKRFDKVALGVGFTFNLFTEEEVAHVLYKETATVVKVDGYVFNVCKATSFDESIKVDTLLDTFGELRINNYSI